MGKWWGEEGAKGQYGFYIWCKNFADFLPFALSLTLSHCPSSCRCLRIFLFVYFSYHVFYSYVFSLSSYSLCYHCSTLFGCIHLLLTSLCLSLSALLCLTVSEYLCNSFSAKPLYLLSPYVTFVSIFFLTFCLSLCISVVISHSLSLFPSNCLLTSSSFVPSLLLTPITLF